METGSERVVYTREQLTEHVRVPAVVEQDLKRIISERLEQCGLYFRAFSRIKTAASMARKFERKEYGEEHKLQDLIGVRVNLYFDDDVDICKGIMERTFDLLEWSASERSEEEFKPMKLNGVFRLPEYLRLQISPETWDMCIDATFEIQIKTMFFEGWHEIEHDMRYKGEELWSHFPGFSRYFNSILATLELCDKSMVTLFEDLGHALYKSGQWTDMIRCHFRLKMEDNELYPEVEARLKEDSVNVNSLGKRIYRTKKTFLIAQFARRNHRIPINVNTIIAILNDADFHDEKLTAIFRERDVYNDGREESVAESRHYELRPLVRHNVFRMETLVNGNRMREEEVTDSLIFTRCAEAIYRWTRMRYGELFLDMPAELSSYQADMMAYHVLVDVDEKNLSLTTRVRHIDPEVGGRIWFCETQLRHLQTGGFWMDVFNGFAEPQKDQAHQEAGGLFFSYPGFYKTIVDSVGIVNGLECSNRRRILKPEQFERVCDAIRDHKRLFPIIVIISPETADGYLDEDWLGAFRVSDFTRTVWRYTHVFSCYEEEGRKLLEMTGTENGGRDEDVPGFYIFWPDGDVECYGPEEVRTCSFGRHLEARTDARTYDIVYGGQAFYHKIVTDLRDYNTTQ